ncbi:MAG: barstar family protein, partial [Holophaga sp.]|nr:barstar family protein [Holophaga sp.]
MNLEPLMKPAGKCFHGIQADADAALEALAPLGREENAVFRHLRGTRMGSPRQLFDEWAAVLQFPVHFGENWDALDECL